jgi:hypothetical protein
VGEKAERHHASDTIAAYHEARLIELAENVAEALDSYRADEIDVFAVDEVIHQYHNAARKLWSYCWAGGRGGMAAVAHGIEMMAAEGESIDWWELGKSR